MLSGPPGAVRRLAGTAVAVLGAFGSGWVLEAVAGRHTDTVILAVVLALTLSRVLLRGTDRDDRRLAVVLVPAAAAAAAGTSRLMASHPFAGDAVFCAALASAIWVRRFGARWARAGTQLSLPFVAVLIAPPPAGGTLAGAGWSALTAAIALLWAAVGRIATAAAAPPGPGALATGRRQARPTSTRGPGRAIIRVVRAARPGPMTRLAAQMAVGLALAFALGHRLWPAHWTWPVLTAYLVASGGRSRADVTHKAVLRLVGALVGTAGASLLAGVFGPHDRWAVVSILLVLLGASWLRERSYAYWAAGATAALALLYGYLGEGGLALLHVRLAGIALGAGVGVAAAWAVLPIRGVDVLRRRIALVLIELDGVLAAVGAGQLDQLRRAQRRFDRAASTVEDLAAAERARDRVRLMLGHRRGRRAADLALITGLRQPVGTLGDRIQADPTDPARDVAGTRELLAAGRRTLRAATGGGPLLSPVTADQLALVHHRIQSGAAPPTGSR